MSKLLDLEKKREKRGVRGRFKPSASYGHSSISLISFSTNYSEVWTYHEHIPGLTYVNCEAHIEPKIEVPYAYGKIWRSSWGAGNI